MATVTLTIMDRGLDRLNELKRLLRYFEMRHRATVEIKLFTWEEGWEQISGIAGAREGADVSEIGTTWLGALAATGGLRPLTTQDLVFTGASASHFLPAAWDSCQVPGKKAFWALPWLTDTRVLYYRRDLLAQAGMDEAKAFSSPTALFESLARIAASSNVAPWVIPTTHTLEILHNIASWVWGAGGEFVAPDGRSTRFAQEAAIQGMADYFDLYRFIPEAYHGLDAGASNLTFQEGRAAMTLSGPWLLAAASPLVEYTGLIPEVRAQMGIALPPGVPFVGGSHLVVWKHTRESALALELVGYLTGVEVQHNYCRGASPLPARLFTLLTPPFNEPHYQLMARSLRAGRSFKSIPQWGLIEGELADALNALSATVLRDPEVALLPLLRERLQALAERLDDMLQGTRDASPASGG